jgi:hypothetical protein
MEGFMNALFTTTEHLYDDNDNNSVVEQPPPEELLLPQQPQQQLKPPPSPRSVCRMWKTKRRQQRQRAMDLKLIMDTSSTSTTTSSSSDGSLQGELKQVALQVQKVYEDSPEDEHDRSYRYEKYGNRAEFAQSRKPHRFRIVA